MSLRAISVLSLLFTAVACSSGTAVPTKGGTSAASGGVGAGGNTASAGDGSGSGDLFSTSAAGAGGSNGAGGGNGCKSTLDVVYRDFNEKHPDFQRPFAGDVVRRHLIKPDLDPGLKPVFLDSIGCPPLKDSPVACDPTWNVTQPVITSAATFDQWYRDVPDVNIHFDRQLELTESAPGSGQFVFNSTDFFPLKPDEGFGITPQNYKNQNFLFTTEIHLMFGYVAAQKFTFIGDDDMWIFVNGKLALDLGSMHGPTTGVIDFDAQAAALGITPGTSYAMDIFHAERHTDGSNFHIETNISCFTPVTIPQ